MGSQELDVNLKALRKLCQEMGLMDHFGELRQTAIDQQHLQDMLSPHAPNHREGSVFVTRSWVTAQMKRLDRGPQPDLGLFDQNER